jgi:hypothetical protein
LTIVSAGVSSTFPRQFRKVVERKNGAAVPQTRDHAKNVPDDAESCAPIDRRAVPASQPKNAQSAHNVAMTWQRL